ncbi:MAG TPA: Ig-like domain-containing protein [Terriglobales bacterium]|jgi:trimeric autotransporter adhesin|nr:Ig-like domain-containing protein [Terriglobales bacterium]
MLSSKKKLQLVAAFATLFLFALGIGCSGFFVDPVLTSIAVGPTATINQGATVQESAVGTYNDGSTKTLGSGVQWSSSTSTVASVTNSGLVTGASPGSATITAAYQTTSGTSSITVSLGNVTALKITPQSGTVTVNGTSAPYFANATVAGDSTPVDVSPTATWSTSDPTNITINVPTTTGVGVTFTAGSATPPETVTITATYASTTTLTATATLTVN